MTTTLIGFHPPRNRIGEARGRRMVAERSAGWCELCSKNEATRWHARLSRADGGTWSPTNGLHFCDPCEYRVTHPATPEIAARYYRHGWLVRPGQDPALVPVQINHGGYFARYLLTNDCEYDACPDVNMDEAS